MDPNHKELDGVDPNLKELEGVKPNHKKLDGVALLYCKVLVEEIFPSREWVGVDCNKEQVGLDLLNRVLGGVDLNNKDQEDLGQGLLQQSFRKKVDLELGLKPSVQSVKTQNSILSPRIHPNIIPAHNVNQWSATCVGLVLQMQL